MKKRFDVDSKKKQAKTEKKLGGLTALLMTTGGDHLNLRKCVHMK